MLEINLKEQNGIFKTVKLIDAFKVSEYNLTFVMLYKDEFENNLMKIYLTKFDNGLLKGINDQEWTVCKTCMSNIVSNSKEYECVKIPNVINLEGDLKPCLIATIEHFENHYKDIETESSSSVKEVSGNFRFTNDKNEGWDGNSLDSIINKASELMNEEKEEDFTESYKEQKEKMLNMISKTMDNVLENKNKEVIELQNKLEKIDKELRKCELEKKKAMDIIDMYHEKIQKLYKLLKENREDSKND